MDLASVKRYLEKGIETASVVDGMPWKFLEPLFMNGFQVDLIEPGRVVCSMKMPPRLLVLYIQSLNNLYPCIHLVVSLFFKVQFFLHCFLEFQQLLARWCHCCDGRCGGRSCNSLRLEFRSFCGDQRFILRCCLCRCQYVYIYIIVVVVVVVVVVIFFCYKKERQVFVEM